MEKREENVYPRRSPRTRVAQTSDIKEKCGKKNQTKRGYYFWKRAFDVCFSALALLLLSPVILLCLLVKFFEDGKNPVYVSVRVGKGGKPFRFYKIRTMKKGAEGMKQSLVERGLNEADGPVFKMKNDPRVTRFGRFLRKTSLDESLQLFSVLSGKMSVVGPRPPLPEEVERYSQKAWKRLRVKGGLLCLWQIRKNRHEVPFEEWLALDLEYIRKQSFALDMKIICRGIFMVIFDRSGE